MMLYGDVIYPEYAHSLFQRLPNLRQEYHWYGKDLALAGHWQLFQ